MDNTTDITLATALGSITLDKSSFERFAPVGGERVNVEVTSTYAPSADSLDKEHGFRFQLLCKLIGRKFSDNEEAVDVFHGECVFTGHFVVSGDNTISSETIGESRHYFEAQLFPVVRAYIGEVLNLMGIAAQGAPWDMGFGRNMVKKEENDHPEKQEA